MLVNEFVEKMTTINEIFKKQMIFVQILYENLANKYKQNVLNYVVNNEIWFDTRNMQMKRPNKNLSDIFDVPIFITKIVNPHCDGLKPYGSWSGLVVGLMGAI